MALPLSDDSTNESGNGAYLFLASFVQEKWGKLDRAQPEYLAHNTTSVLRFQGKLDLSALLHSNAALVSRHETLRTHFVTLHGSFQQCVVPNLTIPLPLIDLRMLKRDERAALIQPIAQDEAWYPFKLEHGPLIRTTLLWLDDEEYLLLLTLHRSIADAWSVGIWSRELNTFYTSFATGTPLLLPEFPIQYADYAAWQREWLQEERLEQELTYWKNRLSAVSSVLNLPTDHSRPALQHYRSSHYRFNLPSPLVTALDALAQKRGVSRFMPLLAAFQLLLARLMEQDNILIGTATTGRTQIELEGLIGCFANTLLLRCKIATEATFDELLQQVQDIVLEAYEHQELPFDLLADALQASCHSPLPQVFFDFQERAPALSPNSDAAFQFVNMDLDTNTMPYDLMLSFFEETEQGLGLVGRITYQTDLFEQATIVRWTKQLLLLLECVAVDPQQPLSVLLSPDETELQGLLERWRILAHIWAQVLKIEPPDVHTNFFEAGGDSILSLLVVTKAREAGLLLTPKQIFEHQTIAELAKVAGTAIAGKIRAEAEEGQVPLTPIQHWFFDQQLPEPHHWNQTVLLKIIEPLITPQILEHACAYLINYHGALSLRFKHTPQGWEQYSMRPETSATDIVRFVDLSRVSEAEQNNTFAEEAARAQASLNLTEGPLLRFVYFAMGGGSSRLLITIHHLAVDVVSWRILLEDLQTACQQLLRREPIQIPYKTTSFKAWAEHLSAYARSQEIRQQAAYWLAEDRHSVPSLPTDFAGDRSVNIEAIASSVTMELNAAETDALLHEVAKAYHTQIQEILLTALVLACIPWTGSRCLLVDVEGHGREAVVEDVDLSRTIGWFTAIFPVLLDLRAMPALHDRGNVIKAIKEQIRNIPQNGIGYGLLRYLSEDTDLQSALQNMPQAEISFNYLGQFDSRAEDQPGSLFSQTNESCGPAHSLRSRRKYMLDVNGAVTHGRFHIEWTYCPQLHHRETVEMLARRYIEMLQELIAHCKTATVGEYTPSDFSGSNLNQAKLDKIMAKIRSNKQE
ncbi:MAG TPA: condensation domain-containing protein [Ktedonosporobacter sp.]|jgi:non-ribosomal peptide synthase protein (TIGR01720 family)|nr:condensation domain-containing protein [Ktedonosporobacter sp.]